MLLIYEQKRFREILRVKICAMTFRAAALSDKLTVSTIPKKFSQMITSHAGRTKL